MADGFISELAAIAVIAHVCVYVGYIVTYIYRSRTLVVRREVVPVPR